MKMKIKKRVTGKKPKVVFDELHKMPKWKTLLKGYCDTMDFRFFVTGSARLELFQRSGDSMLGRYHLIHLWPLIPGEVMGSNVEPNLHLGESVESLSNKSISDEVIAGLITFSGFPEPFLKQNKRSLNLWHREYIQRIIREDLKDLTRIVDVARVEHLMELLPGKIGSPLSLNSLREDLYCSHDAVNTMIKALDKLFITMIVRPYSRKIKYAISKEPKLYFIDWSRIKDEGYRFENFVAIQLRTFCEYVTDGGWCKLDLYYIRDKQKREVDFLIVKDGHPLILVEAKKSQDQLDSNLKHFSKMLGDLMAIQVIQEPNILIKHEPHIWSVSISRFFNLIWLYKD